MKPKNKTKIRKLRKKIAKIIEVNLPLINKNKKFCQEVADAILVEVIENETKK